MRDQEPVAKVKEWEFKSARYIAKQIGAQLLNKSSITCVYNGASAVIKSSTENTHNVEITTNMVNSLDYIIGAFEQCDGFYHTYLLAMDAVKNNERGLLEEEVSRVISFSVFKDHGLFIAKFPVDKGH